MHWHGSGSWRPKSQTVSQKILTIRYCSLTPHESLNLDVIVHSWPLHTRCESLFERIQPMNLTTLNTLVASATPFLRIEGVRPRDWCRNAQDGRFGPWRYEADYAVLNKGTWSSLGEVLYFVTDRLGRVRMVGQSSGRLKDRWRESPMHDVASRAHLGSKALFHSTAWRAIEEGFDIEVPPFTISALFRPQLEQNCRSGDVSLMYALQQPETDKLRLAYHVEQIILSSLGRTLGLWNRQGVRAPATA